MPSAAAVKAYLRRSNPLATEGQLRDESTKIAAIVVPKGIHQRLSETYGGRNTLAQIEWDSNNLRAALDMNLDAIKSALKLHGATETQIENARAKMHKLNSDRGLYK